MKIRIITDSASDLNNSFHPQLSVAPLHVIIGEKDHLDGVDLDGSTLYQTLLDGEVLPKTSQVVPDDFAALYKAAAQADEQVLVIAISSKLSGTYQSARIAAEDYPGCVTIVDSEQVTVGERILVEYALRLLDEGKDFQTIVRCVEEQKKRICLVALADTLEFFFRGGRISRTAAAFGTLLAIKPVLAIRDGEIVILGKARGSKNGRNMLREEIASHGVDFSMPLCLGYTGLSDALLNTYIDDNADLWNAQLRRPPCTIVGPAIGTHAGPNAIAAAFFAAE